MPLRAYVVDCACAQYGLVATKGEGVRPAVAIPRAEYLGRLARKHRKVSDRGPYPCILGDKVRATTAKAMDALGYYPAWLKALTSAYSDDLDWDD